MLRQNGYLVESKFYLGMGGSEQGGRFFSVVVPDRTRESLQFVIKKFILPGTHVRSDGWRAYRNLDEIPEFPYVHTAVVHNDSYVNELGEHTNTIEGTWNGIKQKIPKQSYRDALVLQSYLCEQMWRKGHKGREIPAFVQALCDYTYDRDSCY